MFEEKKHRNLFLKDKCLDMFNIKNISQINYLFSKAQYSTSAYQIYAARKRCQNFIFQNF